jgi:2-C-methyl-D-erythritol 4-phosphate cytidylyltransferase
MSKHTEADIRDLSKKIAEVIYAAKGIPSPRNHTTAIIVAAGNSTRMGKGLSKQLMLLRGKPVLAHTLLAYQRAQTIHDIVVAAKPEDFPAVRVIAEQYGITKLRVLTEGGASRQETVLCGLRKVSKKTKYVAIADGARCLTTPEQIEAVCHAAYRLGAASAATPATDTVKIADNKGFIQSTPDRSTLWMAQTPQVFDYQLYHAAAYYALDRQFTATDDNSLIEFVDRKVKLVDCGHENIKITTAVDLLIADAILRSRESTESEDTHD